MASAARATRSRWARERKRVAQQGLAHVQRAGQRGPAQPGPAVPAPAR